MKPARRSLIFMQILCLLASLTLMAKPLYRWGRRQMAQIRVEQVWQSIQQEKHTSRLSGEPALWLCMEDSNFSDLVVWGDTKENLERHASIAWTDPMVILGHRDTHFRKLKHLRLQDRIQTEAPDGTQRVYEVTETEILPSDIAQQHILEHRDKRSLVLMTCYPFEYIGPAPDRYLVWAQPL